MPRGVDDRFGTSPHDNASPRLPRLPKNLLENAQTQADRRRHNRQQADRRQSDRAVVGANASLARSLDHAVEGRLYNLSTEGCAIRISENSFSIGDAVWFRIDSIQPWKGIVCWVQGERVGVEFERPLYRSLSDLIAQSNEPVTISWGASPAFCNPSI